MPFRGADRTYLEPYMISERTRHLKREWHSALLTTQDLAGSKEVQRAAANFNPGILLTDKPEDDHPDRDEDQAPHWDFQSPADPLKHGTCMAKTSIASKCAAHATRHCHQSLSGKSP